MCLVILSISPEPSLSIIPFGFARTKYAISSILSIALLATAAPSSLIKALEYEGTKLPIRPVPLPNADLNVASVTFNVVTNLANTSVNDSVISLKLPIVITPEVEIETKKLTTDILIAMGKTKEEAEKLATKLIIDQKVSFEVANTTKPLSDSLDLLKEMQAVTIKTYPQSLLDRVSNYETILYNSGQLSLVLAKELNDKKKYYVKLLDEELTAIRNNNSAYSLSLNLQQIVNSELLNTTIASNTLASTLSNVFSGLNVDLAEKIASMESKLQEAAIAHAKTATEAVLVNLSNKDVSIDSAKTTDEKQFLSLTKAIGEAYNEGAPGLEKLANLEKSRNILREKIINDNSILAIQEAKKIHLTQEQIKVEEKLIKENKWSTMMIESAKQVTSAWEDAKAAIANGMGKDGKSIADSLKDSLGKGTQGIQDYIGAKLGKKQAVAFDALENKAKDYFLGSKDKDGKRQDGIFKSLGDKFTSAFPKLGKVGGFLGDAGGLDALKGILSKDAGQRNAAIGGALGSVAGKSIGMAFSAIGGPLGMAVGSVLGNIIGSTFGKKLKETGVLAKVSELGVVSANSIEIYKKTSLSGTKTIEQVGNSLEAEAISALQNAVTNTRKSYESNILSFNAMTKDVFQLTLGGMTKAFSAKYLQAAGGGKSEGDLLKDFVKDYGNFLGSDQLGFLNQFKDVTESLTDVLARLVNTLKVTDTAFKSAFGKGTSLVGNLSNKYAKEFIKNEAADLLNGSINKFYDTLALIGGGGIRYTDENGTEFKERAGKELQNLYNTLTSYINTPDTTKSTTVGQFAHAKPIILGYDKKTYTTSTSGNVTPLPKGIGYFEEILPFLSEYSKDTADILVLIEKYINNTITSVEKAALVQLAALDFTDRIVKAFDGENIAAKTEAYNKAMFGYANMVTSSISVTSGQIASIVTDMSRVNATILPPGLQAVKNGLLIPVQEFNKEMRKAVENGVSPEKIAEGIKLGSKLSEVISGVLETFSSISLADLKNASDFSTSVNTAIMSTFKSSATDSFKKSLLAPLLVDLTTSIDKASVGDSSGFVSSMKNYALSGDIVATQAKNMTQVLSDPAFKSAMTSVSIEFEKLMKVFDSANSSEIMLSLSKAILDIEKTLKESAYSFAVNGDAYSVALFKAKEAFKAAGLSSDYATQPIGSVVAKMKQLASTGLITTTNIDAVNDALNAMADASMAARDQIQATVEASAASMDSANNFISSLTNSIISDSDSMSAAKTALTGLLTVASDKVDKARAEYAKARASGNLLAANQAAENLTSSLESYVNQEIEVNNTLKSMAEDRYNTEKAALDNLKTIISDIADFIKELKFDDKLSILKPMDRLNEASKDFEATKAKVLADAASGKLTPEAIKNLQEDSKRLLDLGRDAYASSDAYTALYNSVTAAMGVVNGKAEAEVLTYEASTKMYQDMALSFAKDTRDIQVDALTQLKILTKASAVDNAIAVDMINALKYNKGLEGSVTLSGYYKELFKDAQGGGTIFTQPEIGYNEFQGIGTYDDTNKAMQEANNAKLNQVLDTLTTVLQNLPVNVKSAIQSTATPTTNRN